MNLVISFDVKNEKKKWTELKVNEINNCIKTRRAKPNKKIS